MEETFWKKCSSCKKSIPFNAKYYICSVSTCTGQRTGYSFCSVDCWEVHVPGARHRDAGALERKSPASGSAEPAAAAESIGGTRRIVTASPTPVSSPKPSTGNVALPRDILIVASKLKDYIRARADMNTSGDVMSVLSDYVRFRCDEAIDNARREGRKTVMDRDFTR